MLRAFLYPHGKHFDYQKEFLLSRQEALKNRKKRYPQRAEGDEGRDEGVKEVMKGLMKVMKEVKRR